ncbi:MAG: V-type ATP synthase subunit E family protein [Candidatus Micrarchaeota archaeon]|nr:V-type ATP synthase subunit E family protein [Candidatus Micrarchaeota archaeon]
MGFEDLASELHKSAEAEARKIVHSAEKNAEKIEAEAKEKAELAVKAAKREAIEYSKQESSERLTSAKLSAKKIIDEAKEEAVDAALKQVWEQFKSESLKKSNYPQILDRLIREGLEELGAKDAIVHVRDEDRALVSGFRLAKLPPGYSGGAILESADGKVRVNKTLEEVFSQKKPQLRKEIFDRLF